MTGVDILRELGGNTCCCGVWKREGNSFCRNCFASLPAAKKQALYKRFGKGYEEAHLDARQFLGHGEQPTLFAGEAQA